MIDRRLTVCICGSALLFVLSPGLALADAVDDFVRAEMARERIPGLSLAITRDGRLVKAEGYGLANVELQAPARPETIYQSGSVGKQFTATAVMMLAEDGKLDLDDPITKYFAGAPAGWKRITIRHLLTHTSGIKDWEGKADLDYRRDYTEDDLVKVAMKLPPDFPPGTQWSYSNTGYCLLGILIHKVSGTFYGDLLQQRVFGPLGMTATRVISEADIVPNRAAGYQLVKGELKNQDWVSPSLNTTADGSLYLTVLDMAKWDAALDAERLLKRSSFEQMWTPVRLSNGASYPYGFGWSVEEQRGRLVIEHGGSWQGFRTAIARYPEQKLGVIVLANLAEAEPEQIAHSVAGLLEPALELPDPRTPASDPDGKRTATVRAVMAAWGDGKSVPEMGVGLRSASAGTAREKASRKRSADRLENAQSFAFLGEDDVAGRRIERRGETIARVVHYSLLTRDAAFAYRFYLNATGQVADFWSERR